MAGIGIIQITARNSDIKLQRDEFEDLAEPERTWWYQGYVVEQVWEAW
jgi:hypothetical protein